MERFIKGDVLVVTFPFSDLRATKKRPVLVLAQGDFGDVIVCQITSSKYNSINTITLDNKSFSSGRLPVESYIRPDKIFTADRKLIHRKAARLTDDKINQLDKKLKKLLDL